MKVVFGKGQILVWAAFLLVLGGGLYLTLRPSAAERRAEEAKVLRARRLAAKEAAKAARKSETRIAASNRVGGDTSLLGGGEATSAELIDFDEVELSKEIAAIYSEIKKSFDKDPFMDSRKSRKALLAAVQKLLAQTANGAVVPGFVKRNTIDMLGWAGGDGLSEMVGFMADADAEVATYAKEKFQDALDDFTLSDREISAVLKEVVKVEHDQESLDMYISQLSNMRNSVKVDTALAIVDSGNEDAVAVLENNLDFHFGAGEGDYEVKTRADIVQYGKDNPDGEDDEAFYGGGVGQEF